MTRRRRKKEDSRREIALDVDHRLTTYLTRPCLFFLFSLYGVFKALHLGRVGGERSGVYIYLMEKHLPRVKQWFLILGWPGLGGREMSARSPKKFCMYDGRLFSQVATYLGR